MNALEQNRYTDAWRALGASLPRPRAILAISAHWVTRGTAVTAMPQPRTIHDFGGFPRELFEVQYPAPGDPALAERVRTLLAPVDVQLDQDWGLDHGTWSVLAKIYPDANIPAVQLSLDASLTPSEHYGLARQLAPLREEGVLILGSGNVVHNLGRIRWTENAPAYDWAMRFNDRARQALVTRDHEAMINYLTLDTDAPLSVPTTEHYLPLLYILAQQGEHENVSVPVDGIELGSISMLTAVVGLQGDH